MKAKDIDWANHECCDHCCFMDDGNCYHYDCECVPHIGLGDLAKGILVGAAFWTALIVVLRFWI